MLRFLIALLLATPALAAPATLITGARVFDGTGSAARVRDVRIEGERIVAVGRNLPRQDATIIDARGLTLLPGLHDLHIHTRSEVFADNVALTAGYAPYLAAGITTINEFSVAPGQLALVRAMVTQGAVVPRLNLAIRMGVPGGHGTESIATNAMTTQVSTPEEARAALATLLPLRPDLIKVFQDGWRYGDPARPDKPTMDLPTLSAIVDAARAQNVPVVTHTVTAQGAAMAAEAGVTAVVHGIGDSVLDRATIALMKKHGMAYVSTLVVYEPQQSRVLAPRELAMLSPADRAREQEPKRFVPLPIEPWDARRWQILQENIRLLHKAGVRLGIGTDAGIAGVYHGFATIREIVWLTKLGFTPAQALRAATSVSAAIMNARDNGRIASGQHADLLLTGGKPDVAIDDLYDVRGVWVGGRAVDVARAY